jgi:hypothetical protein
VEIQKSQQRSVAVAHLLSDVCTWNYAILKVSSFLLATLQVIAAVFEVQTAVVLGA